MRPPLGRRITRYTPHICLSVFLSRSNRQLKTEHRKPSDFDERLAV